MSWKTFHNRGETLRSVVETANERRDGLMPMSEPGVSEHFTDALDLVGALLLKWHARLSGNIERALVREPMDLEAAVAAAWQATAEELPGVRLVIDRCTQLPESPEMERAMHRAQEHEWMRLATAAGLASGPDAAAVAAGRRVEDRARERLTASAATATAEQVSDPQTATQTATETSPETGPAAERVTEGSTRAVTFVDRIKAVLAA